MFFCGQGTTNSLPASFFPLCGRLFQTPPPTIMRPEPACPACPYLCIGCIAVLVSWKKNRTTNPREWARIGEPPDSADHRSSSSRSMLSVGEPREMSTRPSTRYGPPVSVRGA